MCGREKGRMRRRRLNGRSDETGVRPAGSVNRRGVVRRAAHANAFARSPVDASGERLSFLWKCVFSGSCFPASRALSVYV